MKTLVLVVMFGLLSIGSMYNQARAVVGPDGKIIAGSFETRPSPAQLALMKQKFQLDQNAQDALNIGNYAGAIDFANKDLALPGLTDEPAQEIRAEALFLSGQDDLALQACQQIVEQENGLTGSDLLPYALLELKAGSWSKAAAAYNKLYYPNPNQTNKTTGEQSPFDPATPGSVQDLESAIRVSIGSFYHAGEMWLKEPTLSERQALVEFKQALALEPDSTLAQFGYANWLLDNKRLPEAKAIFKTLSATAQGHIKADADDALKTKLANVPDTPTTQALGQN